ncbi:MAG: hypothetical protein DRH03_12260 [Deltaproteobacteria bacterium]|nr:MAG: hypothetical protein DRH03_12260 [Deltaproteobacteria bacterium]
MINNFQILKKKSTRESGFTLVELMVVIVIIAVIAGFTMAEINSSSYKLKGAAQTLRAKMQQAKLLAVKENCNVFVDFDLDGAGAIDSFYTLWQDLDGDGNYDTGVTPPELLETVNLPQRIAFGRVASGDGGPGTSASETASTDIVSFSGDSIRFSPQGTGSQGWAYLCAPGDDSAGTYAVGSNNVGRIQTRKWVTNDNRWRGDGK